MKFFTFCFPNCKGPQSRSSFYSNHRSILNAAQKLSTILITIIWKPLSLEMLADVFSLSKEHLSRTFKTYMDTTFKKYLTSIRVHHAYQDLMDTDLSILQIALDNGFSDARAFSSAFYSYYGETPLKYRKNSKESDMSHQKRAYLRTHGFL